MIVTCDYMRNQPLAIHEKIGVLRNVVDVGVDVGNEFPTEVGQLFDSFLPVLTSGFAMSKYNWKTFLGLLEDKQSGTHE